MDYLKFVGLSLFAVAIFVVCAFILDNDLLSVLSALVITGAAFARIKPAHFKVGYAIWIAVSLISFFIQNWVAAAELREALKGNPYAFPADATYFLLWLAVCALSHPICYILGKRLARFLPRAENTSAVAEHFD